MELNMRVRSLPLVKYVRKRAKSVLTARLRPLTTQIEANLVPSVMQIPHGHFAHWHRCKALKMLAFPASLRLTTEQIVTCHFGLNL